MGTKLSTAVVTMWTATKTMASSEIRRWSSVTAKRGRPSPPTRVVVRMPRTTDPVNRTRLMSPVARVVYQRRGLVTASTGGASRRSGGGRRRPAPEGRDGAVRPDEAGWQPEPGHPGGGLVAPDDGGRRHGVGVETASGGDRHESPPRLGGPAGLRVDDVVQGPTRPRPGAGGGAGAGETAAGDGDHALVARARAPGVLDHTHRPAPDRRGSGGR